MFSLNGTNHVILICAEKNMYPPILIIFINVNICSLSFLVTFLHWELIPLILNLTF